MSKSIIVLLSLVVYANISFAQNELPVLICNSLEKVNGWDGSQTNTKLKYTAYIKSSTELLDAEVTGAYYSDKRDISIRKETKSFVKFQTLEDAWNWFVLSIPKNFNQIDRSFTAYVNVHAEDRYGWQDVEMKCFIKHSEISDTQSSVKMSAIADEIGEYFSEDEVINLGLHIERATTLNAPKKLVSTMDELLAKNNEQLKPEAGVSRITGFLIKNSQNTEVIGYVIKTDERYKNNSLHDGSGITYYLDTDFNIVAEISWAG